MFYQDVDDNVPTVSVENADIEIAENPQGFLQEFGEISASDLDFDPDISSYNLAIE